MNILSQKVDEIEWLGQELGKQFLSKPGSLEKNKSQFQKLSEEYIKKIRIINIDNDKNESDRN